MASLRAPVLPETLSWAREVLGASIEDVARAANVKPERVRQWEDGNESPTVNQLSKVARKLERTIAFFFIPPPQDSGIPHVVDFRSRGDSDSLPASVNRHLKRAEARREFLLGLQHEDATPLPFAPFDWDTVEERATTIRSHLLSSAQGPTPKDLNQWISVLEDAGILIFQTTGVPLKEFRGASVFHPTLPIIIINGADSQRGRIFSIFHEIGHLCNRSSAMCLNLENRLEEVLCNRFSAELLAPRREVARILANSPSNPVDLISRTFGISPLAAVIRLRSFDYINDSDVERVREETDEAWERKRAQDRAKEGFVPQWRLRYRDLGPKYVSTVIGALEDSRIDYLDASYMLDVRVPTVTRLQQEAHEQGVL